MNHAREHLNVANTLRRPVDFCYTYTMQEFIDATRRQLSAFINEDGKDERSSNQGPYTIRNYSEISRLINKIPSQNYQELSKQIPIAWL